MVQSGSLNPNSDFPHTLAKPAKRALTRAGYTRLAQLTDATEDDLLQLHGVGPKALEQILQALKEKGLAFAEKSSQ